MTRVKIYNPATGKINLKTSKHVRLFLQHLLEMQLGLKLDGIVSNIPQGSTVLGLIKLILVAIQQENDEELQRQIQQLEGALESKSCH